LHADSPRQIHSNIKKAKQEKLTGARCLGFHLEGPFINKEMAGAQPKKFITAPTKTRIKQLLNSAGRDIKIITLACELNNSLNLIRALKKHRIIASLGHTNASFEQAERAIDAGASYTTHVFNRMGSFSSRAPGIITNVLLDNRITAEVIADGHHVHPALLRLLVANKPPEKIVLVTDSVAAINKQKLKLIKNVYRLENLALNRTCSGLGFTIAGSNLTMIQALKNMIKFCGINLVDAIKMASLNPAKVIGISNRKGSVAKGKDADLVMFDKNFKVKMTIVSGNIVFKNF
jgi:N-acetylglucosamine-6-phosphate deacetylase